MKRVLKSETELDVEFKSVSFNLRSVFQFRHIISTSSRRQTSKKILHVNPTLCSIVPDKSRIKVDVDTLFTGKYKL